MPTFVPFTINIADPTADKTYNILKIPAGLGQCQVVEAIAATDTALAEGDTNVVAVTLLDGGAAGTGTAAVSAEVSNKLTGSNGAWAAGTGASKSFVISEVLLDEGDHLTLKYDETGAVAGLNLTVSGWLCVGKR